MLIIPFTPCLMKWCLSGVQKRLHHSVHLFCPVDPPPICGLHSQDRALLPRAEKTFVRGSGSRCSPNLLLTFPWPGGATTRIPNTKYSESIPTTKCPSPNTLRVFAQRPYLCRASGPTQISSSIAKYQVSGLAGGPFYSNLL